MSGPGMRRPGMARRRRFRPQVVGFAGSRERFDGLVSFLEGQLALGLTHSELETRLQTDGRELLRQLFQDHVDLRAITEQRLTEVVDANGVARTNAEGGHGRVLATVVGEVRVRRIAYRRRGVANLHPADARLNLPEERYSYGLRRLAAIEASRGSFDDAVAAVERATGQQVGKRQVQQLTERAAADFDAFYTQPAPTSQSPPAGSDQDDQDVLALSYDAKGVVMRPDALRPATAKAAAQATPKLATRLSKGEKRNRKRMAEVGAVYQATPAQRTPADIMPTSAEQSRTPAPGPVTTNKWLTASVADDAASVINDVFDQAQRRDPHHRRTWVALVDGNNHQIDATRAQAAKRQLTVPIIVDFIHVLEYLWKAAWCLHTEADPAAEDWVRRYARKILDGKASQVARAIRRAATAAGLPQAKRAGIDTCADYLTRKAPYLDYLTALANGWPIATGVIEGACRHLIQDRMGLTGARWGLSGAEAVLKLRALYSNGDFDRYWTFHLNQEHQRNHQARYAENTIPQPIQPKTHSP